MYWRYNSWKILIPWIQPRVLIVFHHLWKEAGVFPSSLKQSYFCSDFQVGCSRRRVKLLAHRYPAITSLSLWGHHSGQPHFSLQEFVMFAFTASSNMDCIYRNYSKAFDRLNHRLLVVELQGYRIWASLLQFLEKYLCDRSLIVKLDGATFKPFPVVSGVPQGLCS